VTLVAWNEDGGKRASTRRAVFETKRATLARSPRESSSQARRLPRSGVCSGYALWNSPFHSLPMSSITAAPDQTARRAWALRLLELLEPILDDDHNALIPSPILVHTFSFLRAYTHAYSHIHRPRSRASFAKAKSMVMTFATRTRRKGPPRHCTWSASTPCARSSPPTRATKRTTRMARTTRKKPSISTCPA
jgi:hypothetical protein